MEKEREKILKKEENKNGKNLFFLVVNQNIWVGKQVILFVKGNDIYFFFISF